MKNAALQFFAHVEWTTLALILFFVFFTTLVVRVFGFKDSRDIEQLKWVAFDSGEDQ